MLFNIITLFPEMFAALNSGITGRALKTGLIDCQFYNPRDYTQDKFRNIDDRPYGGGPGMVMMVQPLRDTLAAIKQKSTGPVIYLSPQGKPLSQVKLQVLTENSSLILLNGRYEGIDERLLSTEVDEEISLGDYVISGGELASMVLIDGITRLLPGALGDENSAIADSFVDGLLDYPHYTRPETIDSMQVPPILLSGDHQAIARWRMQEALRKTWQRRPDLLKAKKLTAEQQELLDTFIKEVDHE